LWAGNRLMRELRAAQEGAGNPSGNAQV
jgi:hypothetical protein